MGDFSEMEFEEMLEEFAAPRTHADGCAAAAVAGMLGASLLRKTLGCIVKDTPCALTEAEASDLKWEVDDATAHFAKLLDKNKAAIKHVRAVESGEFVEGLTADEVYRGALSVAAATATSAARVAKVAHRLSLITGAHALSDVGCALQLLYASFMGGKMKMNDYFASVKTLDEDFVRSTRGKVQEIEDEISQLVGPALQAVWQALDPKSIEAV